MRKKKSRSFAEPAKVKAPNSFAPTKIKSEWKSGPVLTAAEQDFLNERLPDEDRPAPWHVRLIREFWAKPVDSLEKMFKDKSAVRLARQDIQRLLQILE